MILATLPKFNVKDVNISGGLASELTISNTDRSDGGRYACFASNSFGRDQMSVHLYVQEPPEFPRNVHVIEKGSRLVKLGWLLSPDGNSPITKYTVEYKTESDLWHDNMLQLSVSGSQANALVTGLRPATTYHFRLFAENQLGRSQPSDVLDVTTDGEAPGGAPRNVQVEATSSTELQVTWEAPESQLWNGDILGYHVGYKEQRVSADQYQYRSVENRLDISSLQRGEFILTDLMKFTSYSIVLQAYNALGPGPATQEIVASTLEDVPSAPPSSVACTALTSQSLQVSWDPPPHAQLHGLLKGYKLLWENTQQWETSSKPETKITTGLTVVVHGLEKHNNYSIQVLAFTRVGDGVPSTPLFCMTEEDVPEAPAGIKTVVSSGTSIIVSWLPPLHSNGIITTYNLQIRILSGAGQEAKMFRRSVPPQSTSYEAEGLLKRVRYEFVVAAVTRVGEGPSSDPVSMSPSTEVKAAIYSFGILIVVPWKQETRLPCRHVGKPDPRVNWKQWGQPLKLSARLKVAGDGALVVTDLRRDDSGNFSCHVENRHGSDHITHKLIVQVPPSAPLVHSTGSTTNSMTVQWKQGDDGGAPIRGFVLHYKEDQGEWEEVKISRLESSYVLDKLLCGTSYQMYVTALNSIGMGPPSETVVTTTDGGKPGHVPPIDHFLHINSTFVTLFLGDWADGGCPILYFEVEYKTPEQEYWTSASNNLQMQKSFTLNGLIPGTEYHLLVKAHNNAGAVTAEYRFQTLNKLGEVDGPLQRSGGSLHVSQTAAVLDNKQNMEQREQYYATVRKPLRSPVREMATLERIPEYSEDIYPYATFELNESASGETRCTSAAPIPVSITPSGPTQLHTFVYHDPRLSAADTLQVRRESDSEHYSKVRGARSRRKSKSFKSESEEYDSLGSDSDTEQGTSSRTESSNHLDDPGHPPAPSPHPLPSKDRPSSHRARGHNFVFRGPESSTSTEPSPTFERKSFPRRARSKMLQLARYSLETSISKSCGGPRVCGSPRFKPRRGSRDSSSIMAAQLDPPSGFSDALELSEAECDLDPSRRAKRHHRSPNHSNFGIRDFTIAV
uniref:Down syndrome cell adhesion molecule-like protein Dscam2 n=1 Tax=Timema tahoe TaxID=61484 RepID=A0A7R9FMA5_9NEOP|nr:unnamed protein product [Timema tahoe]